MTDPIPHVIDSWRRVVACLAEHAERLQLCPPASADAISELERGIGSELPGDYRAWLSLHDGQDQRASIEWLPGYGRLLAAEVVLERWRDDQEWVEEDDEGLESTQDDDRIRNVVRHAKRIPIAGNIWGDGDNTYLDLVPGPSGTIGQVIVATSECDFEVIGSSFTDFLRRWATAFEDGTLMIDTTQDPPRVDWATKKNPWDRWEAALRSVRPR